MTSLSLGAALERQLRSRFRSPAFVIGAVVPALLIGCLLFQTASATQSPATIAFLAIVSALWIGGSACVREIVDERRLIQREPHLSLLSYGIAKVCHAVVLGLIQSAVLTVCLSVSDVVRLPFINLWTILFLTTVSGSMLAMLLSAVCDESATALAWFPLLLVPQVVFGGFLFPYGSTVPFSVDPVTKVVTVMPPALVRPRVESVFLHAMGAVSVSRWALEGYAAEVLAQDMSNDDRLQEAVQATFFIPLTLTGAQVSSALLDYVRLGGPQGGAPAPTFDSRTTSYRMLLVMFAAGQALLLLVLLPLRDPRRI